MREGEEAVRISKQVTAKYTYCKIHAKTAPLRQTAQLYFAGKPRSKAPDRTGKTYLRELDKRNLLRKEEV